MQPLRFVADTPDKKRKLAEWLGRKDPESLGFIKEMARAFGPLKTVEYENE